MTRRVWLAVLAAVVAFGCIPGAYGVNFSVRQAALEDGGPPAAFSEDDLELAKAVAAEVAEKYEMVSIFERYGDELVHNGQRELALYQKTDHGKSALVLGVSVKVDLSELLVGFVDSTSSTRTDENMEVRDELKWRLEKAFPDRDVQVSTFKKTRL